MMCFEVEFAYTGTDLLIWYYFFEILAKLVGAVTFQKTSLRNNLLDNEINRPVFIFRIQQINSYCKGGEGN